VRRQFFLGVVTGLVLASFARRVKTQGITQSRLDEYYRRRAKNYHLTDYLYLGQFPRVEMRKKLIEMMNLKPGDHVLDFACGTGANFPYILEKIGPTGRLVATDYSPDMLREASEFAKREGWQNIDFVQADAAKMHFDEQFDVVMSTMGLAVIPGYQEAMLRGWEHLKPGGTFAIGDICESERWYTRPIGFLNDFLDIFIVADTSRRPWKWMEANGENYRREEVFHGYFYAATVRKPKEAVLSV